MAHERIREGFEVYVHDGDVAFGAVRQIAPGGRPEILVYVENAGDFSIPLSAVRDVHDEKVVLDCGKLDRRLREAIGHAHTAEDPDIAAKPDEPPVD
ncbi:MAG TPA: hypothetical protein VKR31_02095 [Rhizomicrobium sp.]|nr:hypothetical protein [Rhizomicrobium sp.]